METDKKAREGWRFTPPRMFFLIYLIFLLSTFQSSVLMIIWGHVSGFPQWTLLSSGNNLSKLADLFETERRFAAALAEKNFYFGLGNESEDGSDLASGFLVTTTQFGEKSFLFTASHVVSIVPYRAFQVQPLTMFPPDGEKIEVEAELKVSLSAELAAAHAPEAIVQKITPAILYTGDPKT